MCCFKRFSIDGGGNQIVYFFAIHPYQLSKHENVFDGEFLGCLDLICKPCVVDAGIPDNYTPGDNIEKFSEMLYFS